MVRATLVLVSCMALSGCTGVSDLFSSPATKINKAFPVSAAVRIADENLRTLLAKDKDALEAFEDDYAARMELRGLTCAQSLSIGRFTSVEEVQSMPVDQDCLKEQDKQVAQLIGLRHIGARFAQGPLRPMLPLGRPRAILRLPDIQVVTGTTASAAGVAVLHGTRGEVVSVEIPGGQKIAVWSEERLVAHGATLSPNGRILAASALDDRDRGTFFIDTETGTKLLESAEIRQVLAWLPEVSAAVISHGTDRTLALIDFKTGRIVPHPMALENQNWALTVSGSPSRLLIGNQDSFSEMEHTRTEAGIKAKITREFRMTDRHGVTSMPPVLMLEGRAIVFATSRNLKMFNLETGRETLWESEDVLSIQYAKLDESTLLVASSGQVGTNGRPWAFDIEKATIAPVQDEMEPYGIVYATAGRTGFMRRGALIWFGDDVRTGSPVSLESAVASYRMERQLAQLEAAEEAPERVNRPGDRAVQAINDDARAAMLERIRNLMKSRANGSP